MIFEPYFSVCDLIFLVVTLNRLDFCLSVFQMKSGVIKFHTFMSYFVFNLGLCLAVKNSESMWRCGMSLSASMDSESFCVFLKYLWKVWLDMCLTHFP